MKQWGSANQHRHRCVHSELFLAQPQPRGTRLGSSAPSSCQPGGPAAFGALTTAGSLASDIEILAFLTPCLLQLTLVGVGHTIRATNLPGQGGKLLRAIPGTGRQVPYPWDALSCPAIMREGTRGKERRGARTGSPELLGVLTGLRGTARQVKSHTQRSSSASSSHQPPYRRHRSCSHSLPSPEPEPPEPHSGAKEGHGEKGLPPSRAEIGESRSDGVWPISPTCGSAPAHPNHSRSNPLSPGTPESWTHIYQDAYAWISEKIPLPWRTQILPLLSRGCGEPT